MNTPWIFRHRTAVVAASAILAAGVWIAMFAVQISDVHRVKLASIPQQTDTLANSSIQDCVAGPQRSLSSACKSFDVDTDGDVDLADISSFQLAYNQ